MANTFDESQLWTPFHKKCDYLLRFQTNRRINESILLQKWPKNISNVGR